MDIYRSHVLIWPVQAVLLGVRQCGGAFDRLLKEEGLEKKLK